MLVYKHTETIEYVKSSLPFKKNANFTGKQLDNYKDLECETFRAILSYKHEHIRRFSNLH